MLTKIFIGLAVGAAAYFAVRQVVISVRLTRKLHEGPPLTLEELRQLGIIEANLNKASTF